MASVLKEAHFHDEAAAFAALEWANSHRNEQAAQILHWWPRIEKALSESKPKDCWKVPHGYNKNGLDKIAVNFDKAAKAFAKG